MSLLTKVVVFGADAAAAAASGVQIFADPVANINPDGTEKTVFYPGDSQFLLVIVPEDYELVGVKSTAGTVVFTGVVQRDQEDRLLFVEKNVALGLSQLPVGGVSPLWYGKSATLTVTKQEIAASSGPCIADVSYKYAARQYKLTAPGSLPIGPAEDDDYPIGVIVYVKEVA